MVVCVCVCDLFIWSRKMGVMALSPLMHCQQRLPFSEHPEELIEMYQCSDSAPTTVDRGKLEHHVDHIRIL